eukprot:TRINITY_DN34353_c0_g1_i1.p1 TRINITY_DN34353_c0_g1~~TRINITY_DN34353_c0_g1_i1.p1  ORF type:complete len:522 (+),score=69.63 TRINITY_DN34353_c0_g1_i1:185-1567(+)
MPLDLAKYAFMDGGRYRVLSPYATVDENAMIASPRDLSFTEVSTQAVLADIGVASSASAGKKRGLKGEGNSLSSSGKVMLAKHIVAARRLAFKETERPLIHGRNSIWGLAVVMAVRAMVWGDGRIRTLAIYGIHFLAAVCDAASLLCSTPLYAGGLDGHCVKSNFLGSMLSLIFTATVVDSGALMTFAMFATPQPLRAGPASLLDKAEATVGVWEWLLLASVGFQVALCVCSWRIYSCLRRFGLYPPGDESSFVGEIHDVSVLEVMCETDDAEACEAACRPDVECWGSESANPTVFSQQVVDLSSAANSDTPARFQRHEADTESSCVDISVRHQSIPRLPPPAKSRVPVETLTRRPSELASSQAARDPLDRALAAAVAARDAAETAASVGFKAPALGGLKLSVPVASTVGDADAPVAGDTVAASSGNSDCKVVQNADSAAVYSSDQVEGLAVHLVVANSP